MQIKIEGATGNVALDFAKEVDMTPHEIDIFESIEKVVVRGVDRFSIGLLPGVAEHLQKMLSKIDKDATTIDSANAAMEVALWFKDHVTIYADRHPNTSFVWG